MDKHLPEVFYNKLGSTGAVVCSCGFSITFTVLHENSESLGLEFFHVSHDAQWELVRQVSDALKKGRDDTRAIRKELSGNDPWACVDCGRPQHFCICHKAIAKATGGNL